MSAYRPAERAHIAAPWPASSIPSVRAESDPMRPPRPASRRTCGAYAELGMVAQIMPAHSDPGPLGGLPPGPSAQLPRDLLGGRTFALSALQEGRPQCGP